MADTHPVKRFAEITAQAYIDEYPDHVAIDPQWLRQTWEVDAANEKWFTCTWGPYQKAALAYFAREKHAAEALKAAGYR